MGEYLYEKYINEVLGKYQGAHNHTYSVLEKFELWLKKNGHIKEEEEIIPGEPNCAEGSF